MGMYTYVIGIKPPDEKWEKMKTVYDSCEKAGIEIPDEVEQFFEGEEPNDLGVKVELIEDDGSEEIVSSCFKKINREGQNVFQVDLDKLPKDVKYLEFINSY